ncbi:molybdopterin molybdotransferase [Meinhardsimonia xiamenensis]|uniref:Molybdopterin molybdenumtransferase n=1 Tax=Meinhardsimonia xiamenensis TaxID=990712 RepID=A0A1G9CLY1_9RHOB|nr:gephyrin-like molybdotransferase Glp [Meinhardsimonia xiamenensis]PRX38320.1 molybdopterin molybdotransferase [Meinhardsimonia xiamenensis]SDK52464.1 molybdopterin molybdotransferase [Meinhardsimonia xiamenensis]
MIPVSDALERIFALVRPLPVETVPLREAAGRVLRGRVEARRDQPPFDASAMDGYAARAEDVRPGARLKVIGEAPAGRAFAGRVGPGEAVRIFTGAPLPEGASRVVIQEDVTREGDEIVIGDNLDKGFHIRPRGGDFAAGTAVEGPRRLAAADIALLAAMNLPELPVTRRPEVAIISTGDELVMPGGQPRPDQIIASNAFGLAALLEAEGARARLLPIVPDRAEALDQAFRLAEGADLIVTIGGASVGDYDLVGAAAAEAGMERAFYKVAMRPGKPLMAGRLGEAVLIGLPGNPVSSMVCGHVFLIPALRAILGFPPAPAPRLKAPLAVDVPANGPREHYMRARLTERGLLPFDNQDSSLLSILAAADALLIRPVADSPRRAGEIVEYLPLQSGAR